MQNTARGEPAAHRQAGAARGRRDPLGQLLGRGRHALRRLDRAAAAPRELPGAAGGAPERAAPPAAPAGPGALAGALPDAAPRRHRRAGRRAHDDRALRAGGAHRRTRGSPRGLEAFRRGRRRRAARHAAPRPPRRDLPHAGARRRGPHHGRSGGRRAVRAGRHHPRAQPALGLGPPEAAPSRRAQAGRDRLRQAGRQGAGLRQRPRRGVPLRRRRRGRPVPRAGGLRAPSCAS